jgi:hypothetical protein
MSKPSFLTAKAWADFLCQLKLEVRRSSECPKAYNDTWVFDLSTVLLDPVSFGTMAKQAFDVNRGLNLLYIYCDVAMHTIVGDTKTPLLRACNVAGKHGEFVRHTYVQPHYVPVGRREFDSIEIAINNELGKPMPFEYGKSVVTLHFRRKRTFP